MFNIFKFFILGFEAAGLKLRNTVYIYMQNDKTQSQSINWSITGENQDAFSIKLKMFYIHTRKYSAKP